MKAQRDRHRWIYLLVLLLLAAPTGALRGDPGGVSGVTRRGDPVTRKVPYASETVDAVRAASLTHPPRPPRNRAITRPRIYGSSSVGAPGTHATTLTAPAYPISAASPSSLAPVLEGAFRGLENPPHGQRDVIPPNAMGAAGPDHLVSLVNTEFGVFDKATGALLVSVPLGSFWASLVTPPGVPADFPYDTRVLYDQHSGRFVAVSLDCTVSPNSWLMIAVSETSNPLDNWFKWAIDADVDGGTLQTANFADFPGVGIDAYNLYVTANMFFRSITGPLYQHSKIWVIPKAQLLAGSNPTITWTEIPNPPGSLGLSTMQPAHIFGAADAEYLLFEDWKTSMNRFLLAKIDNVSGTPVWNAPVPVAVAPYAPAFVLPDAPQAGDFRGIDTADTRLWNAVYRNGSLWATHHVAMNNKVEIAWYRIDTVAGTVIAQGRISDPARWYYFPSIAVNQDDVAAIGFSGSSTAEYVGGYYTILRPPHVAAEPVALLKSGEDTYFKDFGFGFNRWGDLSATVVDPTDNVTFWTLQEYSGTHDPVSGVSRWGTWWGKFRPSDVPAPSGLTATAGNGAQVILGWTDQSGNESGFRIERRRLPEGDYSVIGAVGQNITSFTDDGSTGLVRGFDYSYRIQAHDSSGGSVSGETIASLPSASSGGGGGGGCLSISPPVSDTADEGAVISVLLLFLPAAVCVWKRRHRLESSQQAAFGHDLCLPPGKKSNCTPYRES